MLARYRVGRGSLREALRILEVYGLIAIRPGPGGGPVVQEVNSREFGRTTTFYYRLARATYRDVLEAREIFEPMMAKVAAQRATDAQIKELVESSALSRLAVERDDETWGAVAGEFGMTKTDVLRSVRVALQARLLGRSLALELGQEDHLVLLALANPDEKRMLARTAVQERWTAIQLREKVAESGAGDATTSLPSRLRRTGGG